MGLTVYSNKVLQDIIKLMYNIVLYIDIILNSVLFHVKLSELVILLSY